MAILVVQLADLHVRESNDRLLSLHSELASAICTEITADVRVVVLAICGDAAFSGERRQFDSVVEFIDLIANHLRDRYKSLQVLVVAIPGNHDCDFAGDQDARERLLNSLSAGSAVAGSTKDILLRPESNYFAFAERVAGSENAITAKSPFYKCVQVTDGDDSYRLHLLNTAWTSRRDETQGALTFPLATIVPPPGNSRARSIAILHHPTYWFRQPDTMRPFRDRVEDIAAIVLVNHEHSQEAFEQRKEPSLPYSARTTVFIAGGALQDDSERHKCTFNTFALTTTPTPAGHLVQWTYATDGTHSYFERSRTRAFQMESTFATDMPSGYVLSQDFAQYLEDPGTPLFHPRVDPRTPLRLSDVFMYPDFWELDSDHKGTGQRQIRSSRSKHEILKSERLLITGGEKSGRTSLAKQIFKDASRERLVPLLIRGSDLARTSGNLRQIIRDAVPRNYSSLNADAYDQLKSESKVLIVDDVHTMPASKERRCAVLAELEQMFGRIILCGDDLIKIEQVSGQSGRDSGLWDYRHFLILGFGEVLREAFIRKWVTIPTDLPLLDTEVNAEVERLSKLVNAVMRRHWMPAYPLFLIVVLQQTDIGQPNVLGGSFGHLFEGVITAILKQSRFRQIAIGDKYNYLAALAMQMFEARATHLRTEDCTAWHCSYWNDIEVQVPFEDLVGDLCSLGVLSRTSQDVRFKYPYLFCFFVAYHLNQNLHEAGTRAQISRLCRRLHHRLSADIVLFLAHLTGDPIVLDQMVETCDDLFRDVPEADFLEDVEPLNRLGDHSDELSLSDRTADENRRAMRMRTDDLVEQRLAAIRSSDDVDPPEADSEAVRRLFEINAAHKSIQILGQALRNVAGSASKDRKEEVITKLISLSCRLLGSYFDMFRQGLPQIVEDFVEVHRELEPELADVDLYAEVRRHLFGISQFVVFVILKHASTSIGADNLAPTINRILRGSGSANVSNRLFDLSFQLDRPGNLPKREAISLYGEVHRNFFTAGVVRMLVAHHLYLYTVPFNERQSICDKLSIKIVPVMTDPRRKLLKD